MKKSILSFLLLTIGICYGQELNLPVATQYLADNPFVISPTFAGIGDNLRIRANGMTQWVGIKDAPENQSIYADFRIADQSGVGLSVYNDKNGNTSQKGIKMSFAHHIILDYYSKQYLSFGLSFNINNFEIDYNKLNPINFDPTITNNRFVSNNNFDVGLLYRNRNFFMSLNASNILNKNSEFFTVNEPNSLRNFQLYSGYVFNVNNDSRAEIEPSVYYQLFASDGRSSTDINVKYRKYNNYDDYYWAGISYRFLNDQLLKPLNLGPMVGIKKANFYFGYSYQLTLNQLAAFNTGTHVITIGLDFLQGISSCSCTESPAHN